MHNKRGQAAMEFLMTYGWAILIVLIALAALFFLGVFNPARTTNVCIVSAPFTCTDVKASGTTLTLVLAASGAYSSGPSIAATGATVNGQASTAYISPTTGAISTTTPTAMTWTIPSQTVGSKFSGTATISYTLSGGTSHTTSVQFSGVAE